MSKGPAYATSSVTDCTGYSQAKRLALATPQYVEPCAPLYSGAPSLRAQYKHKRDRDKHKGSSIMMRRGNRGRLLVYFVRPTDIRATAIQKETPQRCFPRNYNNAAGSPLVDCRATTSGHRWDDAND